MEKKRNNIIEKETHLSFQNSKSVDYEKFKEYLVEKDKLNKETTEFYKRDVWRKMKLDNIVMGRKVWISSSIKSRKPLETIS